MKLLLLLMLSIGSISAFAAMGEDKVSTDGVMCQEEVGKVTTSSEEGESSKKKNAIND